MSQNHAQDAIFAQIANQYVERYGETLQQELRQEAQGNVDYLFARLDRLVDEKIGRTQSRRRNYRRVWGSIAACLILTVLIFPLRSWLADTAKDQVEMQPMSAVAEAAEEIAWEEEVIEEDAIAEEPMTDIVTGGMDRAAFSVEYYEVIPLRFELPETFTLSHMEQDRALSIYYLSDENQDDAILTLQPEAYEPLPELPYVSLIINDTPVSALIGADYQLITFEKDAIRYTLTCQHDINTIAALSAAIL